MEQQEFEEWMRRMRPRLVAEALRLLGDADDAEDTAQDAVLKLWSMRQRLCEYRSVDALSVVMVRRMSLNRLRRPTSAELPELTDVSTPETTLISREEIARLERLLQTLPDAQQTVLRMKHLDGMEVAEIARVTGSTPEAVRQSLSRARHRIMKQFKL